MEQENQEERFWADRTNFKIKNLEEELWYDIKKAKRGSVPSHAKVADADGNVAKSKERHEILADHFEKKLLEHKEGDKQNNDRIDSK